jgi:hypothetical protein
MTEPTAQVAASVRPTNNRGVAIASVLCWGFSCVNAAGLALFILIAASSDSWPWSTRLKAVCAWAFLVGLYAYAGFALRRQRRLGGWAAGLVAALYLAMTADVGVIGSMRAAFAISLLVNIAIIGLVVANWRHLRSDEAQGLPPN